MFTSHNIPWLIKQASKFLKIGDNTIYSLTIIDRKVEILTEREQEHF